MTLVRRRLLGFAITLLVGGAAAGVALWQSARGDAAAKEASARAKVLALADAKHVREVELTTPAGTFVLEHSGTAAGTSAWALTKPLATPADGFTVDALLGELVGLERTAALGEKDPRVIADKALFGLSPPRFRVTLVDDTGKRETLLAGKKNAFDGSLYVQREGRDEVLLVAGGLEYQLDQNLFKLRDKRLTAFDAGDVARLAVDVDGKPRYALESGGQDTWKLTAPRALAADSVEVGAILSALSSASATSFVTERATPADLARTGLDRPQVKAVLTLRTGAPRTLLFSEASDKGTKKYYAALAGQGPVLELSSSWVVDKLAVQPDSLRDKHVVAFDRDAVGKLELAGGGKQLAFERTRADGAEKWSMTAPTAGNAQDATLEGLLYRVWNLQAKKIVTETASAADLARYGLDAPALSVSLARQDGTPVAKLLLGKTEEGEQYAMAAGSHLVALVDGGLGKDASLDPASYRDLARAASK